MRISIPLTAALLLASAAAQAADDWAPKSAFIAAGEGAKAAGTITMTAGAAWPWAWHRTSRTGEWTAYTEAFLSHLSAREPGGGRRGFNLIGVVPMVRYRFGNGQSPWFAEAGIGVSVTDHLYVTERKSFSTRFNFHDNVGVGRSFGPKNEHEMSLRITHVSNAGIRHPNPGENFIQLRYGRNF